MIWPGISPRSMTAQGSPLKSEHALSRKDGRTIWVHLTLTVPSAMSEAADLVVAMIEDVTEVRRTQSALVQAERLAITGRVGGIVGPRDQQPAPIHHRLPGVSRRDTVGAG